MGGWMDGWIDGYMNKWMDVWVGRSLKAMSIVVWSAMGIWENMWNGLTGSYRFWVYVLPEWQESQL